MKFTRKAFLMTKQTSVKNQIKAIAQKLELSTSTVSAVLGGRADTIRISKETQKRVRDMAREMNYQPNIYARRLRQAASEETPYVIVIFWRQDNLNSRIGRFISGLKNAIDKKGYKVELMVQPYKPGEIMNHVETLSSNRVSGAIISGLLEEEQEALEKEDYSIPIVLIGRDSSKFHSITMDNFKAGETCIATMKGPKVKTGAVIGFTKGGRSERMLEAGFMLGCREREIEVKEEWNLYIDSSSHDAGYKSCELLLSRVNLPSAWLVADYRLAGGIMDCLDDKKIRVPEDVRLIFFEESDILKYNKPPLSSMDVPSMEMAEKALEILILTWKQNVEIPLRMEVQPLYAIRESSGK